MTIAPTVFPPSPPWQPFADVPLGDSAFAVLKQNLYEILTRQKMRVDAITDLSHRAYQQNQVEIFLAISDDKLHGVLAMLNGLAPAAEYTQLVQQGMFEVIEYDFRNRLLPHFGVMHLFRWLQLAGRAQHFWVDYRFQCWLAAQPFGSIDLRALAAAWRGCGQLDSAVFVANASLAVRWEINTVTDRLPAQCVWPFFAEHLNFIDAGLGVAAAPAEPKFRAFTLEATLKLLAIFPVLQPQWLTRVLEVALGTGKTNRAVAVAALASQKNLGEVLLPYLHAPKIDTRIEAANLLADLQYQAAVPALIAALKTESRESARAALLASLERLGQNIAAYLTPEILYAEALKGLKSKEPSGLAWFNFAALPTCTWRDGGAVEPDILRWWVVFTCKLKEPGGNALVTRYLQLLAPESRAAFSLNVLLQFIAEDSRQLPLVPGMSAYDKWLAKREYITSAIGEKGILALIPCAPGHELVAHITHYMRDHHLHRAQIEAMLEAAASVNKPGSEPLVIQLLIGVARRHRTASVQQKAQTLIAQIAETNGWTHDELSDRTTPTAGLDETGKVTLQYGARTFHMVLNANMKFVLQNDEGKEIKALPEPRKEDDAELIKTATAQFSVSKKELKLVLDSQAVRLQEAMCVNRLWPVAQWLEYLHGHPIVGRLTQRLLWIEYDENSLKKSVFRPSEDGTLVDLDDNEVQLAPTSTVCVAHACLLDAPQVAKWLKHFKDYKITPLFAQLTRHAPALVFEDTTITAIASHQGWMSDTYTLRSAFIKLGYQRAAEDGGYFEHYVKAYASIGLKVRIEFSGNTLPEENIPAALKTLSFESDAAKSWDERLLPLQKVPPVLLAEAHADYLAVAQVGAGFDAQWEDKVRF